MYIFVSVSFTPVEDPNRPLADAEWARQSTMMAGRVDAKSAKIFEYLLRECGYEEVNLEEFASGLPTSFYITNPPPGPA